MGRHKEKSNPSKNHCFRWKFSPKRSHEHARAGRFVEIHRAIGGYHSPVMLPEMERSREEAAMTDEEGDGKQPETEE